MRGTPFRIEVHRQPVFRVLRLATLPDVDEPLLVAAEHLHVLEGPSRSSRPPVLRARQRAPRSRLCSQDIILVADVRRVTVEHGVLAFVLFEDIGPVEVLDYPSPNRSANSSRRSTLFAYESARLDTFEVPNPVGASYFPLYCVYRCYKNCLTCSIGSLD